MNYQTTESYSSSSFIRNVKLNDLVTKNKGVKKSSYNFFQKKDSRKKDGFYCFCCHLTISHRLLDLFMK